MVNTFIDKFPKKVKEYSTKELEECELEEFIAYVFKYLKNVQVLANIDAFGFAERVKLEKLLPKKIEQFKDDICEYCDRPEIKDDPEEEYKPAFDPSSMYDSRY